jgi:hypothetical protein
MKVFPSDPRPRPKNLQISFAAASRASTPSPGFSTSDTIASKEASSPAICWFAGVAAATYATGVNFVCATGLPEAWWAASVVPTASTTIAATTAHMLRLVLYTRGIGERAKVRRCGL